MSSASRSVDTPAPNTTPSNGSTPATRWSLVHRIFFRFIFVHFVVFLFPAPLTNVVPVIGPAVSDFVFDWIQFPLARVVAKYVLRLPQEPANIPSGSGDTTLSYIILFTTVCIAAIVTAIWSFVQRQKDNHEELETYFRVWLRYTLATSMVSYGVAKLTNLQFGSPDPLSLLKTYGQSSPMDLLWTFMGFSMPYKFFGGVMEFVPALLLLFRRTALLGALLLMGVLANVVMLNMCYDVPVKINSTHWFLVATIIAWPDSKRIVQFFLQNAPTQAAPERRKFTKRWMEQARLVVKPLFIVGMLSQEFYGTWKALHAAPSPDEAPAIIGTYEITSFTRAGVDVPPTLTDKTRWRYFGLFEYRGNHFALVLTMTGAKKFVPAKLDTQQKTLVLQEQVQNEAQKSLIQQVRQDNSDKPLDVSVHFTETNAGLQMLEGKLDGADVRIELSKLRLEEFPLMRRGFHWVNEVPYNE